MTNHPEAKLRFTWTVQNILDSFFIFPKGHDIVLTQPTFSCGKNITENTFVLKTMNRKFWSSNRGRAIVKPKPSAFVKVLSGESYDFSNLAIRILFEGKFIS